MSGIAGASGVERAAFSRIDAAELNFRLQKGPTQSRKPKSALLFTTSD
jgi:hypothetical protein